MQQNTRIKILVSKCLLGENVAWHGKTTSTSQQAPEKKINLFNNSKFFLKRILSSPEQRLVWFPSSRYDLRPFCPEVDGLGLSVPRPPIKIISSSISDEDKIQTSQRFELVSSASSSTSNFSSSSWTQDDLNKNFDERFPFWGEERESDCTFVSAFICKSKSPMCGFHDAKEFSNEETKLIHGGFVTWLLKRNPQVLIATDKELNSEEKLKMFLDEVAKKISS